MNIEEIESAFRLISAIEDVIDEHVSMRIDLGDPAVPFRRAGNWDEISYDHDDRSVTVGRDEDRSCYSDECPGSLEITTSELAMIREEILPKIEARIQAAKEKKRQEGERWRKQELANLRRLQAKYGGV